MKKAKVFIGIMMCLLLLLGQTPMVSTANQVFGDDGIISILGEAPAGGEEDPAAGEEEPAGDVEEPAAGEEEPVGDVEEPAAGEEEPAGDVEEPAAGEEEPAGDVEEPAAGEEEPAGDVEEPGEGEEALIPGEEELEEEVFDLLSAPEGYWNDYVSGALEGTDYTVDGSGNYEIHTATGLAYFAKLVNGGKDFYGKTVTLTADVDISAHYWAPIGQYKFGPDGQDNSDIAQKAFWGTFDGRGHYVDGLTIDGPDYTTQAGPYCEANGLFSLNMGTIKNVGVRDIKVKTFRRGAGIAGINFGTVALCMSSGEIDANGGGGTRGTGGIVGSNYGLVYGCYSSADVYNGYRRAGGIVGYNTTAKYRPSAYGPAGSSGSDDVTSTGIIDHCFFIGYAKSASATFSGSIACSNDSGAVIRNSYYLQGSAWDTQDRGCPVGYAGDSQAYEFNSAGQLTGDNGKTLLNEISALCNFTAGTGTYPILFWESDTYNWETKYTVTIPETITGGGITVTTADGTPVASGAKLEVGTVLKLTANPATDYLFDYFTADGLRVFGSADGATFIVTKNVTLSVAFKLSVPATLNIAEFDDFVVRVNDMQDNELHHGDPVYVGDSFKIVVTLKNGAFPADKNRRYNGVFTYPTAVQVLADKVTRTGSAAPFTYTLNDVEDGDVLNIVNVTAGMSAKTWLDNDYGVTWYDTSWYTGNKDTYTLTTAAQLAGLSYLSNGVTTFEGVTIKLGADIDLANPDGSGGARLWVPISSPSPNANQIKLTGVTAENFAANLEKGRSSKVGYLYYYDASGNLINTATYVEGVSEYYHQAYFAGTFDGQGHTVYIRNTDGIYRGLFGYLKGAEVKNLTMAGNISGSQYVAPVTGGADKSIISNCVNTATITTTNTCGGGIAAYIYDTTVTDCKNYGNLIFGGANSGGIVGEMNASTVTNCANLANITTSFSTVGGIAGRVTGTPLLPGDNLISNCFNTGNITVSDGNRATFGGIAGVSNSTGGSVLIEKCWNSGQIGSWNGTSKTGGILGSGAANVRGGTTISYQAYNVTVSDCYNTGAITDNWASGGKYTGGIVGHVNGATITDSVTGNVYNGLAIIKNCYNTGTVTQVKAEYPEYAGSILGAGQIMSLQSNGYFKVENSYYLDSSHANGIGSAVGSDFGVVARPKTEAELKATTTGPEDILTLLGGAFAADTENVNGGYPVLTDGSPVGSVYKITVDSPIENGAVAPASSGSVPEGTRIVLNVSPNSGYRAVSVTYTYAGAAELFVITPVGGVYSFVMPAYDVTVSASFEPLPDGEITAGALTNGALTFSTKNIYTGKLTEITGLVKAGTAVIVTPKANYGYTVQSVSYSYDSEGPLPITPKNGEYSFIMPDAGVTVDAAFAANNHPILTFDGVPLTDTQLGAYTSINTFTRSNTTTVYECEGIYVRDILAHYVTLDPAATTLIFRSSDGTSKSEVALDELKALGDGGLNAMLAWSVNGVAQQPLQIVLQGTAGGRWISQIVTAGSNATAPPVLTIKSTDGSFSDISLTMTQLKAYAITKNNYTMVTKSVPTTYSSVTGIMLSDLLKYYAPNYDYADKVYFYDNYANNSKSDVFLPKDRGYDSAMLLWSGVKSGETENSITGLRSALDGGGGKYWWSGVTTMTVSEPVVITVKSADSYFSDVQLTRSQLEAYASTGTNYVMQSSTPTTYSAVTGITLKHLLEEYVPYGAYANKAVFYSTYDTAYSNDFFPQDSTHESAMLIWSGIKQGETANSISGLRSALNGGSGKYWWSGVNTIGVSLPLSTVTFSVAPSNASIELLDSKGVAITGNQGVYRLVQGETYSYTVVAGGYIAKDGTITPDDPTEAVAVALQQHGGGTPGGGGDPYYSITGYTGTNGSVTSSAATAKAGDTITLTVTPKDGYALSALTASNATLKETVSGNTNTYTFVMPAKNVTVSATFEEVILTLYSQKGANGTPEKAAVFTKTELFDIMDHNSDGWAYLYAQDNKWKAIVATDVVSIDTLFGAGGISDYWKTGSYLKFKCTDSPKDGYYDKSYPDYTDIKNCKYYIEGSSYEEVVPAGIAVVWESGSLEGTTVEAIAKKARYSGLRFVYGVSQESYTKKNAAGARSPYGVLEMILVYNASGVPKGSVGTTHETEDGNLQTVTVNTSVKETKDNNGKVTVQASVTAASLDTALKDLSAGTALKVEAISAAGGSVGATVVLPKSGVQAAGEKKADLNITTDFGTIMFDNTALTNMAKAAGSGNITIMVTNVKAGGESNMNDAQKQASGDNTVIRLEAKDSSGKSVGQFGDGVVTVKVKYKTSGSNVVVKVYRVNDDGSLSDMNASYSNGEAKWSTGSFSYYMIAEEAPGIFTDVSSTQWYYNAVKFVHERGLFAGVTENTFAPNMTMNRAMFVTVLYRLEGKPAVNGSSQFSDVSDKAAYYYDAVLWAAQNNIVSGQSSSFFGANDPVTRAQMSAILYRYAQYKGYDVTASDSLAAFKDTGSISDWALEAMKWAVAADLVKGVGDGTISPGSNATRAQVATTLQRFVENNVKE